MLITIAFVDNFLPKKHKISHLFGLFMFFLYLCMLKTRYMIAK